MDHALLYLALRTIVFRQQYVILLYVVQSLQYRSSSSYLHNPKYPNKTIQKSRTTQQTADKQLRQPPTDDNVPRDRTGRKRYPKTNGRKLCGHPPGWTPAGAYVSKAHRGAIEMKISAVFVFSSKQSGRRSL